jgi:RNA polymerase sigma factor FliA
MGFAEPMPQPSLVYGRKPKASEANRLIAEHMPLVRKIAWHVHGRVSSALEIDDLVQIGMMALVEAANGYEDRGFAFTTYATTRIRGSMIDYLRKHAAMCRSAMTRRRELQGVQAKLEASLGRQPSEQEMAAALGLDAAQYRELVDQTMAIHHESLDAVYSDQSMWFADVEPLADDAIDRERLKEALAECIAELPQREALVLQLYFVEEMNLEEIGQTINVGAARICQIKKTALDKLREKLADWQ